MNRVDKIKIFEREISYIKDNNYRDNIKVLLKLLPDYFFEIPASSTGKYHPKYALGEGGLVRHTKVVTRIGYELLQNESIGGAFTDNEKDLLLMAMMLHDGLKSGDPKEKYTRFDHPLLVSRMIKDNSDKLTLKENEILLLRNAIEAHMGQWNVDYNGNEVLPKPSNKYQRFVHMCDFLASKKFLEVEFDQSNNIVA